MPGGWTLVDMDTDFVLKPDMATLRRIPWLPATALVICDVLDHHTHEDVPHSPRAILKKQLKRLDAMKMKAYMASELEFFLFLPAKIEIGGDLQNQHAPGPPALAMFQCGKIGRRNLQIFRHAFQRQFAGGAKLAHPGAEGRHLFGLSLRRRT